MKHLVYCMGLASCKRCFWRRIVDFILNSAIMIFVKDSDFEHFDRFGYVKTPLLNASEIDALRGLYKSTESESGLNLGFYTSIWSDNVAFKARVNEGIQKILNSALAKVFKAYDAVFANFMVKGPGQQSSLQAHQDWSFVEEPEFYSVTVWIPLIDVDKHNGALEVIPGSQRLENYKRARFLNAPFAAHNDYLIENYMKSITMKAGEALIVNSRTIHGSPNNLSDETRVAASVVLFPKEAKLKHYVLDEGTENQISEYHISPDFFTVYSCFDKPAGLSLVQTSTIEQNELNLSDLSKYFDL